MHAVIKTRKSRHVIKSLFHCAVVFKCTPKSGHFRIKKWFFFVIKRNKVLFNHTILSDGHYYVTCSTNYCREYCAKSTFVWCIQSTSFEIAYFSKESKRHMLTFIASSFAQSAINLPINIPTCRLDVSLLWEWQFLVLRADVRQNQVFRSMVDVRHIADDTLSSRCKTSPRLTKKYK